MKNGEIKNADNATDEMIRHAHVLGIETIFDRNGNYSTGECKKAKCNFGSRGICCKQCMLGPCRISGRSLKGICGASADTIVARNLLMMIGRGTAAHSSHALHVASTLLKTIRNNTSFRIKEPIKLESIARKINCSEQGIKAMGTAVAELAISDIMGDEKYMRFARSYYPPDVFENLSNLRVMPGSAGRELLDSGHETSMGTMADPTEFILHSARLGVADISSLIISAELQDVLFGTPKIFSSKIGFNVLEKDKVNVVIHGHVPLLSEKIIEFSDDPWLLEKARSFGANGINIVGCCCTGNDALMRHGIPIAGSNIHQELIIATGLAEAVVVDVQCIYPNIENVAKHFHTKIISTMKEARFESAQHIPFDEENADDAAKSILNAAIENFPKRGHRIFLPQEKPHDLMAGFSVENVLGVLAAINPQDPFKPLIESIKSGDINGIVLLAGCISPEMTESSQVVIVKELLKQNVLVFSTGCAAQACARGGLLTPDATMEFAGDKLKGILKSLGDIAGLGKPLPPVWHFGGCVDNSRVIILAIALAQRMGISLKDMPIAASASDWVAEKAAAIGAGTVALGITVHLGRAPPILGGPEVVSLLTRKSEELFGARFIIEEDPIKASKLLLLHIRNAREKLGLSSSIVVVSHRSQQPDNEEISISADESLNPQNPLLLPTY
ncbi:MAG: anaerobic carbon-monoxide dehydrogenase catalytic subunit [Candidatus Methanoperedens sp.]